MPAEDHVPRAYLDHAATTSMLPAARDAWLRHARDLGNASSLHAPGRRARRVVEESRESIAADLGVRPGEIVFTSGGTESDNLAVKGITWARQSADPRRRRLIASAVEHHAVLDPVTWLADRGDVEVIWLPVDPAGRVSPADVAAALAEDPSAVALVTVMWANNEVGTVQPVTAIAAACAQAGVPYHADAVQALGQVPVDAALPGLAAVTISSHKVGGPPGVGALVLRRDVDAVPVLHGGGQERDVRSGTLDVPGIAGFAVAVRAAVEQRAERAARLRLLRDRLADGIRDRLPQAVVNGDPEGGDDHRLPGLVHVSLPGCEGDALLMLLDAAGVACSTGSACSAGIPQPSHVVLAMGLGAEAARGSLRFSLGTTSTEADVDAVLAALPAVVERASRARRARTRSLVPSASAPVRAEASAPAATSASAPGVPGGRVSVATGD